MRVKDYVYRFNSFDRIVSSIVLIGYLNSIEAYGAVLLLHNYKPGDNRGNEVLCGDNTTNKAIDSEKLQSEAKADLFAKLSKRNISLTLPIKSCKQNEVQIKLRFINGGKDVVTFSHEAKQAPHSLVNGSEFIDSSPDANFYSPPRVFSTKPIAKVLPHDKTKKVISPEIELSELRYIPTGHQNTYFKDLYKDTPKLKNGGPDANEIYTLAEKSFFVASEEAPTFERGANIPRNASKDSVSSGIVLVTGRYNSNVEENERNFAEELWTSKTYSDRETPKWLKKVITFFSSKKKKQKAAALYTNQERFSADYTHTNAMFPDCNEGKYSQVCQVVDYPNSSKKGYDTSARVLRSPVYNRRGRFNGFTREEVASSNLDSANPWQFQPSSHGEFVQLNSYNNGELKILGIAKEPPSERDSKKTSTDAVDVRKHCPTGKMKIKFRDSRNGNLWVTCSEGSLGTKEKLLIFNSKNLNSPQTLSVTIEKESQIIQSNQGSDKIVLIESPSGIGSREKSSYRTSIVDPRLSSKVEVNSVESHGSYSKVHYDDIKGATFVEQNNLDRSKTLVGIEGSGRISPQKISLGADEEVLELGYAKDPETDE